MTTFAPSSAKSSAVASPIPEVPPVMSAILSFRRIEGISPKPCLSNRRVLRGLFFGCHAAGLFPDPPRLMPWAAFYRCFAAGVMSCPTPFTISAAAYRLPLTPRRPLSPRETTRRLPPVHRVNLAGGERRVIRREVGEQGRDLLRLGVSLQGNFTVHFIEHRVSIFRTLHGSEHVSGGYGAYSNPGRQFEGYRAGEFDHSRFSGVVIGVVRISHDPVGRGGLQDHAAAVLPHVAGGDLDHVKHTREGHGNHFVPFFGGDVEEVVANADACVLDEYVDAAHQAHSFGKSGAHLIEV